MQLEQTFMNVWRRMTADDHNIQTSLKVAGGAGIGALATGSGIFPALATVSVTLAITGAVKGFWDEIKKNRSNNFKNPRELSQQALGAFKEVGDHPFLFMGSDNDAIERDERRSDTQKDMLKKTMTAASSYHEYLSNSGKPVTSGDIENLKQLKIYTDRAVHYEGDDYKKLSNAARQTQAVMQDALSFATYKRLDNAFATMNKFEPIAKYSDCQRELANVQSVLDTYSDYNDNNVKAYTDPVAAAQRHLDYLKNVNNPESNNFNAEDRLQLNNNIGQLEKRIREFKLGPTLLRDYQSKMADTYYEKVLDFCKDIGPSLTSEKGVELLKAIRSSVDTNVTYRTADSEIKSVNPNDTSPSKWGVDKPMIAIQQIIYNLEANALLGNPSNQSPEFKALLQEVKTQANIVTLTTELKKSEPSNEPSAMSML